MYMNVGVMKDYKLKLRKLRASHTLGLLFFFFKFYFPLSVQIIERLAGRRLGRSHSSTNEWTHDLTGRALTTTGR